MLNSSHNRRRLGASDTRRTGFWMILGAWVVFLGLLAIVFGGWLDSERNPNQNVATYVREDGRREVVLERNRFGHFVASGQVNAEPVEFLIDTGASDVAVPGDVAARLDLKRGTPVRYQTANGTVIGYATTLRRVELGGIVMRNVKASINPGFEGDALLLGMSFLRHLEMTQQGDRLVLRVPARTQPQP